MGTDQIVDVSVIFVNWNAMEMTIKALESLREHVGSVTYEVFVVDNGTTRDASPVELPKRFPWVRFILNPDNRGFSKANNQAIREAKGRYILLLNTDTIQIEDAVGSAVRYMDTHPDVGVLGIQHLNNDAERTLQPSAFPFPEPWKETLQLAGFGALIGARPATEPRKEADVDWVCGSFLLMRRECLEAVGEIDERFFVYDEDIDWCLRVWNAGWKVRFWPGARMIHLGAASKPFISDKTFMHFRSHLTYVHKHHSRLQAALFYGAMSLRLSGATLRQAGRLVLRRGSVEELKERLNRQRQFVLLRSSSRGVAG